MHLSPTVQLTAGIAEWSALGVSGGSSTTTAPGGARELPAGPAPVQLPAKVSSSPQRCRNGLPSLDQGHQGVGSSMAMLDLGGALLGSATKEKAKSEIVPPIGKKNIMLLLLVWL